MDKTVLLINPPVYDFAAHDLFSKPLGLLYLAARLRRVGYTVRLLDCMDRHHPALLARYSLPVVKDNGTGKYFSQIIERPACLQNIPRYYRRYGLPEDIVTGELESLAGEEKPVAVLLTSIMTYWYPGVRDTISLVRKILPGTPVGLGGVYATLMPEHAQRVCQPDRLFTGCDINPLLQWLSTLTGNEIPYQPVAAEFSGWPAPAYDLYGRLDYLALMTSLGCPFRCDYCASRILQPQLQRLAPDTFVEQLRRLLPLVMPIQGKCHIAITDDALLVDAQRYIIPILRRVQDLNLPLVFHCPNGLHARFITAEVAEWMYACRFQMIRLSYESAAPDSLAQTASDGKITDQDFAAAVTHLKNAGYSVGQLEAYVLTGLPGQSMRENELSVLAVHDLGVKIKLCQYSPVPGTPLFDLSCREYGVNPEEPLLHNNSILPSLDQRVGYSGFQQFKERVQKLNQNL